MIVTIDRSHWRTATHGGGFTMLINHAGFQCCLGFYAEQAGVPRDKIQGCYMPAEVGIDIKGLCVRRDPREAVINLPFANAAVNVNDDESLTNDQREEKLVQLFAKHGHELVFTGEYLEAQ